MPGDAGRLSDVGRLILRMGASERGESLLPSRGLGENFMPTEFLLSPELSPENTSANSGDLLSSALKFRSSASEAALLELLSCRLNPG